MEFSFLLTSSSRDFYVVLYGSTKETSSFQFAKAIDESPTDRWK